MKKIKTSDLQHKSVNTALGLDDNSIVKTIIPNTVILSSNWIKFIDVETNLHAVFLVMIGRSIAGSNATYIINVAKWSSIDFCEISASMLNRTGNTAIGYRISYKVSNNRLEVWMYSDSIRAVSCLSANYIPLNIIDTPPVDAVTLS